MKSNRLSVLFGVLVLTVSLNGSVALAHEGHDEMSSKDRVEHKVQMMKEKLSLTDEQIQQLRPIVEQSVKAEDDAREAFMERKKETNQQIMGILNDQQKAKFQQIQEEHKKKMEKRREEHHKKMMKQK